MTEPRITRFELVPGPIPRCTCRVATDQGTLALHAEGCCGAWLTTIDGRYMREVTDVDLRRRLDRKRRRALKEAAIGSAAVEEIYPPGLTRRDARAEAKAAIAEGSLF